MTKWFLFAACFLPVAFAVVPPILQDPGYHVFADQRTLLGLANFWNVVSNLPFVAVALYGLKSAAYQTRAYCWLLGGTLGVAVGSSYYHLNPSNDTLFWDRLPMTVVFMSLVAITAGKLVSRRVEELLLYRLLVLGFVSVLVWRATGDLRLYALVQFGSIAAVLCLLLIRGRESRYAGRIRWMVLLYIIAKVLESTDAAAASILPTGTHPWKHALAASAIFVYVNAVVRHDTNMTLGRRKTHAAGIELGSLP